MIIVNNNKQINISNIWLSLFINDKSYGIAVLGKQVFIVDKKQYSKYWIIDILEKSLSIISIADSLLKLSKKYNCYEVIKNKNSSIKKQLYEELQERRKNILAFIDCEFLPEESIVTLKGLLNDEKIRFMEDVKNKFTEGVKGYELTDNQITFINAVMLSIDNSFTPDEPIGSVSYELDVLPYSPNNKKRGVC